jgi:tetratricopeptide (TPR) repeat protein
MSSATVGSETPRRAVALYSERRLDEAERLFREILEFAPDHADAHHFLGLLVHDRGDRQASAVLLNRAIALDPSSALYRYNVGLILEREQRHGEAPRCYRDALDRDPGNRDIAAKLGDAASEASFYQDAVKRFPDDIVLNMRGLGALFRTGASLADGLEAAHPRAAEVPERARGFRGAFAARVRMGHGGRDRAGRPDRDLQRRRGHRRPHGHLPAGCNVRAARLPRRRNRARGNDRDTSWSTRNASPAS